MENFERKENKPSPLEYLRQNEHVRQIIEASAEDLAIAGLAEKAISESPEYPADLKDHFKKGIPGYLRAPIILDDFKDHSSRREWYKKLFAENKEAFYFYERNKLAHHTIRNLISMSELLSEAKFFDPKIKDSLDKIKERVYPDLENNENKYDLLLEEEKLDVVKILTEISRDMCRTITRSGFSE